MHWQSWVDRKCFKKGEQLFTYLNSPSTGSREYQCGDREVLGPRCSHGKGPLDSVWEPDAAGLEYMISFQEEFQVFHVPQDEGGEGLAITKGRLTPRG